METERDLIRKAISLPGRIVMFLLMETMNLRILVKTIKYR